MAPQTRPVSGRQALRTGLAAKEFGLVLPKRGHGPARTQVQRRNRNRRCALHKAAPCTIRLSSDESRLETPDATCTSLYIEADLQSERLSTPGANVAIELPVEAVSVDVAKSDGKDIGGALSWQSELDLVGSASATCETFLGREDRAALAASALLARVHARLSNGGVNAKTHPAERLPGTADEKDEQVGNRANDVANEDGKEEAIAAVEALATTKAAVGYGAGLSLTRAAHGDDAKGASPRRVSFDIAAITEHEIPPYAEIYGEHPRTFVFDRYSSKIAAAPGGFVSVQAWEELGRDDDEDSVGDELEDK